MATKKLLIYTALASTLLGGSTTYVLIHNKVFSSSRDAGIVNQNIASLNTSGAYTANLTEKEKNVLSSASGIDNNMAISSIDNGVTNYDQQDTQGALEEGSQSASKNLSSASINTILNNNCKIGTQKGYKLIKPMLWAKPAKESQAFSALKSQLIRTIEGDTRQKLLTSASVYLYSFSDGDWTYINPNEAFNPGSLIKVPMLITYLEMAEKDPKIFNKKILCENYDYIPTQTYETHAINPGRTYTVRELLHSMIAYSDNNATNLLNKNADMHLFRKTFTDLNIPEPDMADRDFQISAKRYSRFLIVLYNASYLSRSSSELALQLLSECDFKDGMVKDLPTNIPVAHKFGEWGNNKLNQHVLSESGIVYYNDKPYLLTVMTKGTNVKNLAPEISKISKITYDFISTMDNNANM
ncbi:MAG: hypothetical protein JWQ38_849 [Flavipsychrobacter sp.]|nr:hypothetical protein [Flavipsychrobacter sp.]